MFAEALEDILKDVSAPAAVRSIEAGQSPALLWAAIADAGFLELLASEENGGAGLALPDLYPVLTMLGAHAVPVPFAQTAAARVLLTPDQVPTGMLTFAPVVRRLANGSISCPLVPFGLIADHVLAQEEDRLYLLPAKDAVCEPTGVHGSLTATLSWRGDSGVAAAAAPGVIATFGAAIHSALIAGGMQRVFGMTLQYANDRAQFGKSIGKFQAIQHQISVAAEHVAASSIAAESAFQGVGPVPELLAAAIAKSRTSEAVPLVASIAHAVHGAIGVTEEYDLQLYTRRLHEWRMSHGAESYWNRVVGRAVIASDTSLVSDFVRTACASRPAFA
ncbi:acyl-CoA dehydrogenase [Noviherbaspirillum sedimenti]|uniref:Acyl-CoA dehydrogenase n=1 Tax=Noviherbaspirillum sedimenti TaxID=2320865 RepID=A0A3A3GN80_9BURK|nr:acyl-CoA dehydrogenase [Noviherbaspirillum sedimenti]RJG02420.1 acyl-CoA dehydrogenase [Noviherbaspirillum sedimenti]